MEHNVSKSLTKVYEARKQSFGEDEANQWLVYEMIDRGTEKFTDADRKEIDQYVREQQNHELWEQR